MPINDEKIKAIHELYGLKGTRPGDIMVKVLNMCIDELRQANDTVQKELLDRNQGQIELASKLKRYIEHGLPSFKE